jgi:transposase
MLASRDLVEARSRRKRRSWTLEEKRRIVDESLEEGASIALVARRHDLNANQLFTWRRQFGVGGFEPRSLAPILPVTIVPATVTEDSRPGGQMEIVLAQGDRIIVGADVETVALARVLKALAQR